MDYLSDVLLDSLFSDYAIAGLLIFGIFGLWRFYALYLVFVIVTFYDADKMKYSMIILVMVLSFHYVASLLTTGTKSPLRDVTQ